MTLNELESASGLSHEEAERRRSQYGYNELPKSKRTTFFRLVAEVLREPMVFLLLASGAIYLAIGDKYEAASLLAFLVLIITITIYQENKTETALDALRNLSSPRALVMREGKRVRIAGREVVPGDIVIASEGDRLVADGIVLAASHLALDESLLTGESVPVEKKVSSLVFAGTPVVRGQAAITISATGTNTELGKIGKSVEELSTSSTRLQVEARKLVRVLAVIAVILCVLIFFAFFVTRHDFLGAILVGLTLAMAIIPNELPAVLLIFFAAGARRIAAHDVLTRKLPALENLGSATVLCVDKTGTLTLNKMEVQSLWANEELLDLSNNPSHILPENFHELVEYGTLASRPESVDPMEQAFHSAAMTYLANTEHLHGDWKLAKEYPIAESLLAVSFAWKPHAETGFVVAAKGAPEAIFDLCHLSVQIENTFKSRVTKLASLGLRVIAVAKAHSKSVLPKKQHDLDYEFLGLIGLADPIRSEVPGAIVECRAAGIRVIMLTGDHSETARSIARQIGLENPDEVITGSELEELSDEELTKRLVKVNVFSRMRPDQKLRLVKALKGAGEIVAMTGDGVNDVPALKHADIGIATGQRGTDAAREASDLVLLNDDFSSILTALRMGRRVFSNLERAITYLLAIHVPITLISIVPVLFEQPLLLLPIHVALLHLVIEPACTIVFEAEHDHPSLMTRPPRKKDGPLFAPGLIRNGILQGGFLGLAILGVLGFAIWQNRSEADTRTLVLITLITGNLGLILTNRSWTQSALVSLRERNTAFLWIVIGTLAFLGMVFFVPFIQVMFKFSVLPAREFLAAILAGGCAAAWFELKKYNVEPRR